jgi:hypothetical protein
MSPDEGQVGAVCPNAGRFPTRAVFLYFGIAIYALSFFLPAVNPYNLGGFPGWACAWLAFSTIGDGVSGSALGFFGGLINPIAITYVVLRIRNRAAHFRSALATAILLFMPLTWLSLAITQYRVEIGHVAWITGLLLMISWSDLRYLSRSRRINASV